jgi:integrase/recombinase XerD
MERRNYSTWTVRRQQRTINHFIRWCEARGLVRPVEITRPILERYARHLYYYRKADGAPLSFRTQHNQLSALRLFFKYLTRSNYLLSNPASEIELPRLGQRMLPKAVLTRSEMEQVLSQPDVANDLGIRDRAILETLYSTGMRRMELTNLSIYDLDVGRGAVLIRQGKGKKDRVVPIGERALDWIDRYITDVRPTLVVDPEENALYLTSYGERLSNDGLSARVTRYVDAAAIGKRGSCHLFRHTMATLMLEAGADVRFIQEMLGHAKLDTTQLYTQVSIRELKRVHELTHPSAKRGRQQEAPATTDDEADAESLLTSLAAEAEEEPENIEETEDDPLC